MSRTLLDLLLNLLGSREMSNPLARRQATGYGGMLSFEINGGLEEAKGFLENLKIFALAESLGGVESLIEHPALMTYASIPKEIREQIGLTDSLIRISVGTENVEDLIEDLDQAFQKIAWLGSSFGLFKNQKKTLLEIFFPFLFCLSESSIMDEGRILPSPVFYGRAKGREKSQARGRGCANPLPPALPCHTQMEKIGGGNEDVCIAF